DLWDDDVGGSILTVEFFGRALHRGRPERGRSFAESGPRGGSDLWDDDVGGSILTVEFFGEPPAPIDAVLGVARVTARAIRPLDVITNTERRGSAGWRSWRRA
ncbi:MAG TPA: hypothetical protein PLV92_04725, partial [Pirellulaceae bacterium]|nr:hypothetical protein [Pirellulaceae bacterium]